MFKMIVAAVAASAALVSGAWAQPTPFEARYDAAIPSAQDALGYEFGAEITPPEEAVDYLHTLAAAAPDRMQVVEYATSWQGRTLAYGIIARPETLARIDDIKAGLQRLADPRGLDEETRDALIADLPAVVWLSYGVHGDEISSTDAGLRTAYHLLAAQGDPMVETILDNAIVIVDPTQNPDGRARFVHSFESARGLEANDNRYSAEHDQPWPGGRFNHYLFDMNRDWFAMTQPESRGRVAAVLEWRPVVLVDAHEMGGDNTYFFAPSAEPFNPNIVPSQRDAQGLIGRNHARWFDRLGYDYFTREVYDAFYPGYGDMWPTLQGAVAMTYEQGSARGLAFRRRDGSLLTYGDGVDHHFVAGLSTAEVVASNRERFLRDFAAFRASAAADTSGPQAVLLDRSGNRWGAERLARNLATQDIEVTAIDGPVSACGARFADGAFLVRIDQPSGRLARTLLEATTDLPSDFIREQESRRDRGLGHELYDVTAWSLPLMHNVRAAECRRAPNLTGTTVEGSSAVPGSVSGDASWGYAIAWSDAGQARLVAALAAEGLNMRTTDEAFRVGSRTYPRGSVLVPRHGAPDNLDDLIARHVAETGARADGMASSWVDDGPNPGSASFRRLVAPRIAMLWGEGTSPTEAGATRYVLEQRYNLAVTVIRTRTISRADLSRFDVLVLPEQGRYPFASVMGPTGTAAIQAFVRNGGVVVGLGDATRWMASSDAGLIPAQRERAVGTPPDDGSGDRRVVDAVVLSSAGDVALAEAATEEMPDSSPGALVRVEANPDAWMSAGYDGGASAMFTGSDIYAPVEMGEAVTALRFAGPDDLVAGGYLWSENTAQLAYKPFVISRSYGSGQVIAITQSPTTRAYLEGLDLLLLNAVLLGPAHSRVLR